MAIFTKTGYKKKYLWTHPWELLFHYGRDLKCAFQRAYKGYCFRDLWNVNDWFLELMPRMLTEFKEKSYSYPCYFNDEEEWEKTLDHMIFCFKEANAETCSQKNEYDDYKVDFSFVPSGDNITSKLKIEYATEEDKKQSDLSYQRFLELEDYREEKLQEGLSLFTKYFNDLWD